MKINYELQAVSLKRNIKRFYKIWTWRDLFNNLTVHVHYGRIGTQGLKKAYIAHDDTHAMTLIYKCLNKRLNAAKRIGVNYTFMK